MVWKPVFTRNDEIEDLLEEIAYILLNDDETDISIGLIAGKFGVAVFLIYYGLFKKTDIYLEKALQIIYEIFDKINKGNIAATFSDGIAGISWGMQHLVNEEFIEFDIKEFHFSIEEYLNKSMISYIEDDNFDFLHGALGIGMYFLNNDINNSNNTIEKLIKFLQKISITERTTIKWKTEIIETYGYNFGLSHGIASIIAFLIKAYKKGISKGISLKLTKGVVNYFITSKLNDSESYSVFPTYIDISGKTYINSRLAWCYGDLGSGIALWHVANATNDEDLKQEVINIFLHASKRKKILENGIKDACFCHGTAGIAHIFNRMYNYTMIKEFKKSSNYWFNQTLKMRNCQDGLAGFKTWYPKISGGVQTRTSMLEGIAGIGLSLISAISDIEPKWDECLLLS